MSVSSKKYSRARPKSGIVTKNEHNNQEYGGTLNQIVARKLDLMNQTMNAKLNAINKNMNSRFDKLAQDNEDLRIDFKTMLEVFKQNKEFSKKNVLET